MENHPAFMAQVDVVSVAFASQDEAWQEQDRLENEGDPRSLSVWQGYDEQWYVITRDHLDTREYGI